MVSSASTLRELLSKRECVVAPDAHDLLTAQLVESVGFDAVYVGSFGSAASRWGLTDQSLVGLSQLVDHFRAVVDRLAIPVVVDLEDGGPNAVTVTHNTRAAERAGVAGVQIEDQMPGKMLGTPGRLYPVDVASSKIRAAVEARTDQDTVIIGRTEALSTGADLDAAFDRCAAYAAAGADLVTCSMLPDEQSGRLADHCEVPVAGFVVGSATAAQLASMGISMAIYPMQTALITYREVKAALEALRHRGESLDLEAFGSLWGELAALQGAQANADLAQRHDLGSDV